MIRRIEALNFRCLRYIRQGLHPFNVLVGPNASGKTTFLDVVAFLGDLLSLGLENAIEQRTSDLRDLIWQRRGRAFELAVELEIPEDRLKMIKDRSYDLCRYEVAIGSDAGVDELAILAEKVILLRSTAESIRQRELFPAPVRPPQTILTPKQRRDARTVVNKVRGGNDNFYDETGKGWDHSFRLGPRRSALANLPEDESRFPVSTWLKATLMDGVQRLILNSLLMRKPSPPGQPRGFRPDGSNLPWVIETLAKKHPSRFRDWILHLQTALPDIEDIHTVERPEDRHRYLVVRYRGGLEVPSWMVSDGTLRLLALTLLAYIPDLSGIYLIEEPENGIHPRAIEVAFQSLSSVYGAQILLATHSPVILGIADPSHVLCFARDDEGATDIVRGSEHPALRHWRGETNLGVLFAGGVLG
ncbi:MAG: AAA family ATPase [Clostridia bacterium]|jgi:predicted ATPase|nr:AAA family ATPase [Clostridia bacterium]MDH7572660.1 AAA family ATPase [Clostridia bacterium]